MNHYVYEITNLINGKKYIGKRSCHCDIEEDKYMGSGVNIKRAIKKYGIKNFKKDILHTCQNEEMAYEWEKVYIEQVKAYNNPNYYNIASGGEGGWGIFAGKTEEEMKLRSLRISKKLKGKLVGEKNHNYGGLKESAKLKLSISAKQRFANPKNHPFYGKHHSEETKKKLQNALTGKMVGENHPMYGKHHSEESKLKIREKHIGKSMDEETKLKISKSLKGRHYHTEEYKENLSKRVSGKGNPMYGKKGTLSTRSKKIICINNKMVFNSITEATEYINAKTYTGIVACCKGRYNTSGKINGEPAKWMYYEDYLKVSSE